MGDSDSEEYESEGYESDELNEAYEEAWAGLKDGTVNCLNSDGTFRCPFSPARKKQDYKYREIHQHAVGVGKGQRGPVAAGKHRALQEYLEKDMAASSQPQKERALHFQLQQDVPSRVNSQDKRVICPWMGILQNIDNGTRRASDGSRIGACAADIKEKLKAFNPESVKVMHDGEGHLGVAVIEFRNSMDGFKDAEAFENSFHQHRRGREDFERDHLHTCDPHLYGWMATEKDADGSNKILTDHLKSNGDLKSLSEFVRELEIKAQQQVQNLKELVIKKEDVLQVTYREKWSLTNKVDYVTALVEQAQREKQKLIEDHQNELKDWQRVASSAAEEHESNMHNQQSQIENRMRELENRSSELDLLKLEDETEKA